VKRFPLALLCVSAAAAQDIRFSDEQAFRFNNRKMTDGERFSAPVSGIVGKRVTLDELNGKSQAEV
jgi:hypothetical protein